MNPTDICFKLLDALKIELRQFKKQSREQHDVALRKIVFTLLYNYGISQNKMSKIFGINRSTILQNIKTADTVIKYNDYYKMIYQQGERFLQSHDKNVEEKLCNLDLEQLVKDFFQVCDFDILSLKKPKYLSFNENENYSRRSAILAVLVNFGIPVSKLSEALNRKTDAIIYNISEDRYRDPLDRFDKYVEKYSNRLNVAIAMQGVCND